MGSTVWLVEEEFAKKMGIKWKVVPFAGTAALVPALLGKHVDIAFTYSHSLMTLYKQGEVKYLCAFSSERSPVIPEVTTAKEQGIDVFGGSGHFIIVPNGVPKPTLEKLDTLMKKVISDPDLVQKTRALGYTVQYEDAATSKAFLKKLFESSEEKLRELKK